MGVSDGGREEAEMGVHKCEQLVSGGQIIGRVQCGYHLNGGAPSMPCGLSLHDEDAPIWHRLLSRTRVRFIIPGTATIVDGFVVSCDGTCDHMIYKVRKARSKKTYDITGYGIVWSEVKWQS